MTCFNKDLSSWRLVLELFLREDVSHWKALLLRILLGFDHRLVRLILDSLFCSSPGRPVNFRSSSLRKRGLDTRHLCLLDAAVRHFK